MTGIVNPFPVVSLSETMVQQAVFHGSTQYAPSVELYVGETGSALRSTLSPGTASVFADDVWFTPKKVAFGESLPGTVWVRLTLNSGTAPAGPALNTWVPVSSTDATVLWDWSPTSAQTPSVINANVTVEIAADAGGVTIISSRVGIPVHVEVIAEGTPHVITPPPATQLRSAVFGVAGEALTPVLGFDNIGRLLSNDARDTGSYGDSGENADRPRHWYYPLANHLDGADGVFGWLFATLKSGTVSGSATGTWIRGQAYWRLATLGATTGAASAFLDIKVSTTNSDAGLVGTYLNAELSYSHGGAEGPPAPPADFWTNFIRSYEIP